MVAQEVSAEDLRRVLSQDAAVSLDGPTAAVAAVFRHGHQGTELLFIQRASKDSDPWSGHMAFPGGRTDATDADSDFTAQRETREEVGLDLTGASRLGKLDDLEPGRHLRAIHAHAYWLAGSRPSLTPNYEVADALWVPLAVLADPARHIEHLYQAGPGRPTDSIWPGIQLDKPEQVVWGLTLRFLADLFNRINTPFIDLAPWPT